MSAPVLPSELWRSIFQHAVHVPFVLDTDWDYEPEDQFWRGWAHYAAEGPIAAPTRRAIIQVCREWRELGTEFLYEVIRIEGVDCSRIDVLVEIFKASARRTQSGSGPGYGWWTKRIDCSIDVLASNYGDDLFSLLEQCHNLQILTVSSSGRAPIPVQSRLARVLESRFSHSLRRVDLLLDGTTGGRMEPIDHVSVLPDVRLASLGMMLRETFVPYPMHSSFNEITTLTLHLPLTLNETPQHIYFPRLRNLALLHLSHEDFPALRPMIDRHHKTLLNLHIVTTEASFTNLPLIIAGHGNLQTLTFDDQDLVNLGRSAQDGDALLPILGLSHLGVIRTDAQDASSKFEWGITQLLEKGALPDLRVIRLLTETSPVTVLSDDKGLWKQAIETCRDCNVRLEDRRGQLFVMADSSRAGETAGA